MTIFDNVITSCNVIFHDNFLRYKFQSGPERSNFQEDEKNVISYNVTNVIFLALIGGSDGRPSVRFVNHCRKKQYIAMKRSLLCFETILHLLYKKIV